MKSRENHRAFATTVQTQPELTLVHAHQAEIPRVLIVEHRDEVFARLAWDLTEAGVGVYRATRASDLAWMPSNVSASIILCYIHLPDESGWLSITKLTLSNVGPRVWLYSPQRTVEDQAWQSLSDVEHVFYYNGDLFQLSEAISMKMSCPVKATG